MSELTNAVTDQGSEPPARRIRSFVRRQTRITTAQTRALAELKDKYCLDPQQLNCSDLLRQPLTLEIGFGMGDSLVEQAATHPDRNFLGIEVHQPGIGACMLKAEQQGGLDNLKIIEADAVEVLKTQIPDHSLAGVQIFFPDPWHKKRHHKRRLIQPAFVELLVNKLQPGGTIHVATDWANYAEHIEAVLKKHPTLEPDQPTINRPETKFERRGQRLGHGVWDFVYKT